MLSRLMALFSLAVSLMAAGKETGFLNRTVVVKGTKYKFQVYLPPDWNAQKKWPVIVFLHGSGERGEDGLIQTEVGIGGAIRRHVDRFPGIVVMPQCRKGVWWAEPEMEAQVLAALDRSMKEFKGDADRVYLTGLSMGGYGTWAIAGNHPGKFAAIAPVCGGVRRPNELKENPSAAGDLYSDAARKVSKLPAWVFHGDADKSVPVSESRKMVDAMKAAGANVRYTEYPGVPHNSWDKAYNEPEFATWLFAQQRSSH